jgi:hypothetical protein
VLPEEKGEEEEEEEEEGEKDQEAANKRIVKGNFWWIKWCKIMIMVSFCELACYSVYY